MLKGEADVVAGIHNKMQVALSKVLPAQARRRCTASRRQPGTGDAQRKFLTAQKEYATDDAPLQEPGPGQEGAGDPGKVENDTNKLGKAVGHAEERRPPHRQIAGMTATT